MTQQIVQNLQNKLIMSAAKEMQIECKLLLPGCEDFLELTYRGRTIIINKTRSHKLPLMSGFLAKNKEASNLLLERAGLPVPAYIVVPQMCEEAEHFLTTYRNVTVKPLDASCSIGVTLGIKSVMQLEDAIQLAKQHSDKIMIQKYVEGNDYRVLVIAGKVVAVIGYELASVVGDGQSTIAQLISQLNEARIIRNEICEIESFKEINIQSNVLHANLQAQGKTIHSALEQGERVELFSIDNIPAGEISEINMNRTNDICMANVNIAVEAAQALNIDVAGIDIRCQDITAPITDENGGILEVNALPDMSTHLLPFQGSSIDVYKAYLEYLFEE
ncbi:hypothetical protein NQ117_00175 [Paenibacillus sp. SC116]|uniref:hypothetical protein n=1 Tax=Paenibacillus sp. SC116 TaxID=2968986 RepID=UPI00215B56D5|nr:hypothetical protein [Paenibacillus sp. SC116]MCR8842089.1 hypothetical protein [Paenibacillus sp. SC116]